jgi:hypothetical protein
MFLQIVQLDRKPTGAWYAWNLGSMVGGPGSSCLILGVAHRFGVAPKITNPLAMLPHHE